MPDQADGSKRFARLRWLWRVFILDPRHYQILILSSLIALGVSRFGFHLPWWHAVSCVGSALGTQWVFSKAVGQRFDARSPLISALSLTLLLRTGSLWLSVLAGVLAVGSKYVFRINGKHVFNPANFGIVIVSVLFAGAWVSPGQWGSAPLLALWLAGLGMLVTTKAKSLDLTLGFLLTFAALLIARALYLGDPLAIPAHQLKNGAILIFAFFMISDPKTTPNSHSARLIFAALVALVGFIITNFFYHSAGVIYALILCAPLVPLLDTIFPAMRYAWPTLTPKTGVPHETH